MRLPHGADLPLPEYQSALAAGLDLLAAVPADAPVEIAPGARALIPTGVAIALPPGHEGQVRPRSGLAIRHGVTVLNSPGTVDADYRGEVQVILVNLGTEAFMVSRGMRIAQMIIAPVQHARLVEADESGPDRARRRRSWFHRHGVERWRQARLNGSSRGRVHDLDSFGAIPLESKVDAGSPRWPLAAADASRGNGACRTRSGGAGAMLVRGSADSP